MKIENCGREREFDEQAWIQTHTGAKFNPFLPDAEQVFLEDIAHALSNTCRFAGHTREFYSVAQHSVLVSLHCPPDLALWGLLHDAAEAYLLDMPRPFKRNWRMDEYRRAEKRLEAVIFEKFGLHGETPPAIKDADMRVWAAECRDLMSPLHRDFVVGVEPIAMGVSPLPPADARRLFLGRFVELEAGQLRDHVVGWLIAGGATEAL